MLITGSVCVLGTNTYLKNDKILFISNTYIIVSKF